MMRTLKEIITDKKNVPQEVLIAIILLFLIIPTGTPEDVISVWLFVKLKWLYPIIIILLGLSIWFGGNGK